MIITTSIAVSFAIGKEDDMIRKFVETNSGDWHEDSNSSIVTFRKIENIIIEEWK